MCSRVLRTCWLCLLQSSMFCVSARKSLHRKPSRNQPSALSTSPVLLMCINIRRLACWCCSVLFQTSLIHAHAAFLWRYGESYFRGLQPDCDQLLLGLYLSNNLRNTKQYPRRLSWCSVSMYASPSQHDTKETVPFSVQQAPQQKTPPQPHHFSIIHPPILYPLPAFYQSKMMVSTGVEPVTFLLLVGLTNYQTTPKRNIFENGQYGLKHC